MPKNNTWALIGAGATTVIVFILGALIQFFASDQPWPATAQGWLQLLLPALCAGLLAAITPYYKPNSDPPHTLSPVKPE